jgi:mono/diheme cytochrome c family protein
MAGFPFCSQESSLFRCSFFWLITLPLLVCAGCGTAEPPGFRFNAVEKLKQERLFLEDGEQFPDSSREEVTSILNVLFGTPDQPQFPDSPTPIVDLDRLEMAAGPVESEIDGTPHGLYREHCAHCHGISGDGAGATAALLNPYPRNFRHGKFKFKSTPLRTPPTDDDLRRILANGIPGSAMPSFRLLPQREIDALIDYVKYLSMRGQFERTLLAEISALDGESLFEIEDDDDAAEIENMSAAQILDAIGPELWEDIVARWQKADQRITTVPAAPASFQIGHDEHGDLTTKGRELFFTKGNCTQCHGETASGDGSTVNFDDWTNDWLKTPGVDPFDRETWKPFMALGALKPRQVKPRNLNLGVFRGGDSAEDIYRRIANGIEGSPMPASAALSSDEIWALVAYVKSLVHANDQFASP